MLVGVAREWNAHADHDEVEDDDARDLFHDYSLSGRVLNVKHKMCLASSHDREHVEPTLTSLSAEEADDRSHAISIQEKAPDV